MTGTEDMMALGRYWGTVVPEHGGTGEIVVLGHNGYQGAVLGHSGY